jgi:hypothetical protein
MSDLVPRDAKHPVLYKVGLGPVGLQIKAPLTYEEWDALGDTLKFWESAIGWVLGDWLNYGEHRFGEKYAQALESTDYEYSTLRNYAYVAGRVSLERRRPELTHSHHAEVAMLEADQQEELLSRAVEESWNVRELRKEVSQVRIADGKKTLPTQIFEDAIATWDRYSIPTPQIQSDPCLRLVAKTIEELEKKAVLDGHVAVSSGILARLLFHCRHCGNDYCLVCDYLPECDELTRLTSDAPVV